MGQHCHMNLVIDGELVHRYGGFTATYLKNEIEADMVEHSFDPVTVALPLLNPNVSPKKIMFCYVKRSPSKKYRTITMLAEFTIRDWRRVSKVVWKSKRGDISANEFRFKMPDDYLLYKQIAESRGLSTSTFDDMDLGDQPFNP